MTAVIPKSLVPLLLMMALSSFLAAPASPKKGYVVVSAGDNDTRITVKLSQVLLIVLPAQPGTGYTWQAVRPQTPLGSVEKLDRNEIQELVKDGALPPEPGKAPLGSPEREVFRLLPNVKGVTTLEIDYLRVWEPEKATKVFRLTLRIS